MWKATVKGILARKVRLGLTALAVLLGVSFISGTYVLTDTLDHSFRGFFRQTTAGIDVVVRQRAPFGGDTGRDRFSDSLIADIRSVRGVAAANGYLQDNAQFVDQQGRAIQTAGAPTLGITWSQHGQDGPLHLVADGRRRGHPPRGRHQVAMDVNTAREHGFHIGDRVRVLLEGPAEKFRVVGLFDFGEHDAGAVTFAAFSLPTAQRVFDAKGKIDAVNVVAAPGVSARALRARIVGTVGPGYDVERASKVAEDRGKTLLDFLGLLNQLLLGFAAIGVVVGAFIIFNTFTILLTQRTREFGLMRAMGASGKQIVVSVVVEGTVLGAAAGALGFAFGVGLARALFALLEALGHHVPEGSLVVTGRTVIVSLAVGVGVTAASSIWPAVRASRVPPVAAVDEVIHAPARSFRLRTLFGLALLAAGAAGLVVGLHRTEHALNVVDEIWLVALGALLVFFGAVVLLATFARPLAAVLGTPLKRLDFTGALARGNAMRNPRRSAATASALVIGLALVGLVAIFGESTKASVDAAVNSGIRADYVLKARQFAGFSPQVAQRLGRLKSVRAVAPFRFGNVRVSNSGVIVGREETVAGVPAAQLSGVVDLGLRKGRIGALRGNGLLVQEDAAREFHVGVGDELAVQLPRTFLTLRVAGIYGRSDFTGVPLFPIRFIVSKDAFERGFGSKEQDQLLFARARGSVSAAGAAIKAALAGDFPNIEVLTRAEYRSDQRDAVDQFLAVLIALLLLSELIAVLGIVNTLALSVHERTHELGLLRAVGMSRRQARRMIRGESGLVALMGGLVGIAIGLLWGWVFTTALKSQGISTLEIPAAELAGFLVLSMLVGVAAALAPAWRASRLDSLAAIATD